MNKALKITKITTIGVFTTLFVCTLLIEAAVIGTVIWLGSHSGQSFVKARLNAANKSAEIKFDLSGFSYAFPQGITVRDITVSDNAGKIAAIDKAQLRLDFTAALIKKELELGLRANRATLYRLPKSEETAQENQGLTLESFDLPDLYFTSASLNPLKIQELHLTEDIFGEPITASLNLTAATKLTEMIELDIKANLAQKQENTILWLPEHMALNGSFSPKDPSITLSNLNTQNPLYAIKASGTVDLTKQGTLAIDVKAKSRDLSLISEDMNGHLDMNAAIKGSINTPLISAQGQIDLDTLKERGLEIITFNLEEISASNTPTAQATITTNYNDLPLTLKSDVILQNQILSLNNIEANAPEVKAGGNIAINTDTILAKGNLDFESDNLGFYKDFLQQNIEGQTSLKITLKPNETQQAADIKATFKNFRYQDYTIANAALSSQFENLHKIRPSSAEISAQNITLLPNTRINNMNAEIRNLGADRYTLTITAHGKSLAPFTINGNTDITGIQSGIVEADDINVKIDSNDATLNMTGSASQNILALTLSSNKFKLSTLPLAVPVQLQNSELGGEIRLRGSAASPEIDGSLNLTSIPLAGEEKITLSITPNYKNAAASAQITGQGKGIKTLNGTINIPLELSLYPWTFDASPHSPITGEITLNAGTKTLSTILLPPGQTLTGDIQASAKLNGTIENINLDGKASYKNGNYAHQAYGVHLIDMNAEASFSRSNVTINTFTARDSNENGTMSANGTIDINNQNVTNFALKVNNFHLLDSREADGYFDADLDLKGQNEGYALTGTITPLQVDILIPNHFKSTIPELNIVKKGEKTPENESLKAITLDLDVNAENRIFVRGWGLDAEFGGNLEIEDTLDNPQILGKLSSRRGRYEEFGKRFNLEKAELRFQGTMPPSPYLNIAATTTAEDITATISLTGEVSKPQLALSSTPSYPEDEILSRILFGRDMSSITPFQAIQLRNTIARFSGKGGNGFDPLGELRSATGLDDIRIDSQNGSTTAGVGKYLSDDVYLELEKGQTEGSGAAKVEIELTPNVTVESKVGEDAKAGAGILWRWDY